MTRKKWEAKAEVTEEVIKSREKRKWQINLRRYVIEKSPCPFYAPYFGLDIENIRKWFEYQFTGDLGWNNFGKEWQFGHILPVSFFDHNKEEDLRMCWNFTNLQIDPFEMADQSQPLLSIIGARAYFSYLYLETGYIIAKNLKNKVDQIEGSEHSRSAPQKRFLAEHKGYLRNLDGYSTMEFELLNQGRSIEEIKREMAFFKKNN